MTLGSEAAQSHRLLCSVPSGLESQLESVLTHQRQHVKAMHKTECHTLTSILRYDLVGPKKNVGYNTIVTIAAIS